MVLNAALLTVLVAASVWVWPLLPDQIPIHFNASGEADRMADATLLKWLLLPLVGVGVAGLVHGGGWWVERSPGMLNLPAQDAYDALPDDEKQIVARHAASFLHGTALGTTVLFATLQAASYQVATEPRTDLPWYGDAVVWAFLGLLLVGTVVHVVRLQRLVRSLHAGDASA